MGCRVRTLQKSHSCDFLFCSTLWISPYTCWLLIIYTPSTFKHRSVLQWLQRFQSRWMNRPTEIPRHLPTLSRKWLERARDRESDRRTNTTYDHCSHIIIIFIDLRIIMVCMHVVCQNWSKNCLNSKYQIPNIPNSKFQIPNSKSSNFLSSVVIHNSSHST